MDLNIQISILNRVGKTTARYLARLGIKTAVDLLYWFPFRYEDFRSVVPIKDLKEGELVTVRGKIELIANKRSWKKRKMITEALISDNTGSLRVVWFNQSFLIKNLHVGEQVHLAGKVKVDMLGPQLVSPTYERARPHPAIPLKGEENIVTTHTARMVPIYPLTYGLTQKQLRFLISQVICLADKLFDWVPSEILKENKLCDLGSAIKSIHFPSDERDLALATERLKFDELFLLNLIAEQARVAKMGRKAPKLGFFEAQIKEFVKSLPFTLTKAQKVASWEILQDLGKSVPMNRLLSGDVGSGKTVVAAMAMYDAFLNGYQAVLLAPTEILARQHIDTLAQIIPPNVRLCLFTRSQHQILDNRYYNIQYPISNIDNENNTSVKREIIKKINNGEVNIIIGTHALLSEKINFKKLGLVVVDEQHRFGVDQRKKIKEKAGETSPHPLLGKERGRAAHFLSMTATPIPRSLALTLYGDLDLSTISELPMGRKKILTRLVEPAKRTAAYGFIREQVKKGRQVFVICPLIQPADNGTVFISNNFLDEKKTVMTEYEKLSNKIFPDLRVGFLHGKLPARGGSALGGKPSKESVMKAFKNGDIDILVSTSVVEVGVDIPNASVMMIEGAERFGLAQLHQFRGRVGRAEHQSYCILFTEIESQKAMERLKFFEIHHDGFKLAEKDLEMRGPGEVYGTEQSGMMNLRIATLRDTEIIKKARLAAQSTIPRLNEWPLLAKKLSQQQATIHLE